MREAGFTPGPWEARFDEYGGYDCMWPGIHIGPEQHVSLVTIEYGKSPSDDYVQRCWANARLIAAAPELYEALSDISQAGITEQQFVSQGPALALSHLRLVVERAKAALLKVSPQARDAENT